MRRHAPATMMAALTLLAASVAGAAGAKPLTGCAPDAVVADTVCMDAYEASVWRVPNPTTANKSLVKKIQQGKAKIGDLAKGGATQLGTSADDYAPCNDDGQNCIDDLYAVSLAGVTPSVSITWFQAVAACENARKRLPTNAEWQAAVAGTPDPGPDDGTTTCTTEGNDPSPTGSRSGCRSARGAFDMIGNVNEWVADWIPRSKGCTGSWSPGISPTSDDLCFAGVEDTGEPGALFRGGGLWGPYAGPLAIEGNFGPSYFTGNIGFRCAR